MLDPEAVAAGIQHDLDEKGIAKTAREEKIRKRDELKKHAENERMMRLYRQHVLKEPAAPEASVQIVGLGSKPKAADAEKDAEPTTV